MPALLPPEYREFLHGPVRRYYFATLFGALGTGLILSLGLNYIHDVRHQSIHFAGNLFSFNAVLGLCLAPLIGTLTDRIGPTRVMVPAMAIQAVGLWLLAYASSGGRIVVASLLIVIGGGGVWGPSSVLLTRLVTHEQRQRAYGLNFMLLNVGIGFGGLVSALVVNLNSATTFTHLYLGTGVLTIVAGGVLATLYSHGRPVAASTDRPHDGRQGWNEVMRDRRLLHYVSAAIILMICGYGSLETGFSYFITHPAHLSVKMIGVIFFFNTTTIVFAQIYTLRFIQGRRRTQVLGMVGGLWAVSWLIVALTSQTPKWISLGLMCLSAVIFAIGETFWAPTGQALVNDMAPEHLRGRYNSAAGLTWGLSSAIAPQITALFFGAGIGDLWPLAIAGGVLAGGLLLMTLRRTISDQVDGLQPVST